MKDGARGGITSPRLVMIDTVQSNGLPAAAWHIQRVKTKLSSGTYSTEEVSCFCGSTERRPVTTHDRYGIPHAMHVCLHCGLIYASPRMTSAAYQTFYESEYRPIYDGDDGSDACNNFDLGVKQATELRALLRTYDRTYHTVFDIGCNSGAWLKPFADEGCDVSGVDYGHVRIQYGQSRGIPIDQGGIEILESRGVKADLILLNHVLEHFLDLETMLRRVRALLSPTGTLWVCLPGLYLTRKERLFQNAHPWQFTAETLSYVMECCGFDEIHCDQRILSLWGVSQDEPRSKTAVRSGTVKQITDYLFLGEAPIPQIRTVNKFPVSERKANLQSAYRRGLPDLTQLKQSCAGREAIILSGGPSADQEVDRIRALRTSGAVLIAIERMTMWCTKYGLTPDYVICMDAAPDVVEAFAQTDPTVTYCVAAQCSPAVFDALTDRRVYLFGTPQRGIPVADYWHAGGYESVTVLNGGGSVSLCAMALAMTLGMTALHIFGFDCHVTQRAYADGIVGIGEQHETFQLRVGKETDPTCRIFTTTAAYASFAQQFFALMQMAHAERMVTSVNVYGDSMVNAMATDHFKEMNHGQ